MSTNFSFSYDGLQMDCQTDLTKDHSITEDGSLDFRGQNIHFAVGLSGRPL